MATIVIIGKQIQVDCQYIPNQCGQAWDKGTNAKVLPVHLSSIWCTHWGGSAGSIWPNLGYLLLLLPTQQLDKCSLEFPRYQECLICQSLETFIITITRICLQSSRACAFYLIDGLHEPLARSQRLFHNVAFCGIYIILRQKKNYGN